MSSTQSTPKRTRSARRDTATAAKTSPAKKAGARPISAEQRLAMIAEFAYLRAEQRGFHMGDPVADWLDSEREVDELLSSGVD